MCTWWTNTQGIKVITLRKSSNVRMEASVIWRCWSCLLIAVGKMLFLSGFIFSFDEGAENNSSFPGTSALRWVNNRTNLDLSEYVRNWTVDKKKFVALIMQACHGGRIFVLLKELTAIKIMKIGLCLQFWKK